jgi:hypothetical protein
MRIFILIGIAVILFLVWKVYKNLDKVCVPQRTARPTMAFDNQYEVFRDMEPSSQVRENPWVGFLQEDLTKNRTGPIGDFVGNTSSSGNVVSYMIT